MSNHKDAPTNQNSMSDQKDTKEVKAAEPAPQSSDIDRTAPPAVPVVVARVEAKTVDPTTRPLPPVPATNGRGTRTITRPEPPKARPKVPVELKRVSEEQDELVGKIVTLAQTPNRAEYIKRFNLDLSPGSLAGKSKEDLEGMLAQINNIPIIQLLEDVVEDARKLYQPKDDTDLAECIDALQRSESLQEPWGELKAMAAEVIARKPEFHTGLQAIAGKLRLRVLQQDKA